MTDIWNDPPPVHYDNEERFGTASEMIAEIRRLRGATEKLCDALDSVLHEDSAKSEQRRLTDRVIASEVLHIVRSKGAGETPRDRPAIEAEGDPIKRVLAGEPIVETAPLSPEQQADVDAHMARRRSVETQS